MMFLSQINQLDSLSLSSVELFEKSKSLTLDIETALAFGDVSFSDAQSLKNLLDSIVKNKLASLDQPKARVLSDVSIKELFVQKIAIACENTRESMSPVCNTGVTNSQNASGQYAVPRNLDNYQLISTLDGVVPVLRCVPQENELVGHDWVTFSFCQSTLAKGLYHLDYADENALTHAIETYLDQILYEVFGFGLLKKREKGMHFYKFGYDLQDGLGMVLYGHKSKRISVQINGTGCSLARKGWQTQLYKYLKESISPKLNRVDLAFDDFESDFVSVDLADEWDTQELFWCGGRLPDTNKLGNWKRINGKGRTFTVGDRSSSKHLRFYERGKKEGDSLSLWTRAELELKSTDRHIPLEILLSPTQYFKGAYPALENLCNQCNDFSAPEKCEIVTKQSQINWDKAIQITKHQFGKYIRQFRKVFDDTELLNMISSSKDEVPKRLNFSHAAVMQSVRLNNPTYKHDQDELPLFVGVPLINQPIYEGFINAI
nr:replication initiation factor domain-containing protein [Acinetobacter sp. ANC 4641]